MSHSPLIDLERDGQAAVDAFLDDILASRQLQICPIPTPEPSWDPEAEWQQMLFLFGVPPQYANDYLTVHQYVAQHAKVWYIHSKKCWNGAITCLLDIQEYGESPDQCKVKLTNRLWAWTDARNHILASHQAK